MKKQTILANELKNNSDAVSFARDEFQIDATSNMSRSHVLLLIARSSLLGVCGIFFSKESRIADIIRSPELFIDSADLKLRNAERLINYSDSIRLFDSWTREGGVTATKCKRSIGIERGRSIRIDPTAVFLPLSTSLSLKTIPYAIDLIKSSQGLPRVFALDDARSTQRTEKKNASMKMRRNYSFDWN